MGRYSRLRRIRRMDPRQDFERIYRWIIHYEFPRDYLHGTSIAFLRDFGVPRVSRLLDRTQEFERAGQKRYDDTALLMYEMVREGTDSEHGRATARHRVRHAPRKAEGPLGWELVRLRGPSLERREHSRVIHS